MKHSILREDLKGVELTLENLENELDFKREEYEAKAGEPGHATFEEFLEGCIADTKLNSGDLKDAIFIANNAFDNI